MQETHIHLDSEEREQGELYELLMEAERCWRLEVQRNPFSQIKAILFEQEIE